MVQALIKLSQGATEGDDGEALMGDLSDDVVVENSENSGIGSWEIQILETPYGSATAKGILAQANSSTPLGSFAPDALGGCYRIQLRCWPQTNRAGKVDTDIRCFGSLGENGLCAPPAQIWPEPLPDPRTGRAGAKPNECNFAGQDDGWAGDGEDGLLRHAIRLIRLASFTHLFGSGSHGPLVASSGTTVLTRDTYYSAITLTGTAKIQTNNFKLRCSGKTSMKGAGVEITTGANNGTNAAGATAGAAGALQPIGSLLGIANPGGAGAAGNSSTGTQAAAAALSTLTAAMGGVPGASATGASNTGTHGASPAKVTITIQLDMPQTWVTGFWTAYLASDTLKLPAGGGGGRGGGSGQTSGTAGTTSGGGGGGGCGGGMLDFATFELETDGTTPANAINAKSGNGGNGGNATTNGGSNAVGGGGGAAGGGGGTTRVLVGKRTGAPVTDLVAANGGQGGNGGNGAGTPTGALGGDAGGNGEGGEVLTSNLATGITSYLARSASTGVVAAANGVTGATATPAASHGITF